MPDTQRDNQLVKGIECNVAAKVEGVKHLRPEYIKWKLKLNQAN